MLDACKCMARDNLLAAILILLLMRLHAFAGNIKLTRISSTGATLLWDTRQTEDIINTIDRKNDVSSVDDDYIDRSITRFSFVVRPQSTRHGDTSERKSFESESESQEMVLDKLHADTVYEVSVTAYGSSDEIVEVKEIIFKTPREVGPAIGSAVQRLFVYPSEILVVVFVLTAWVGAVALFLHKWGKIRIVQPREYRFKHNFKNLENVKIVQRATDSVIYRTYPNQLCKTMEARAKKFQRMRTMPNIKVGGDSGIDGTNGSAGAEPKKKEKFLDRMKTVPLLEIEEIRYEQRKHAEEMEENRKAVKGEEMTRLREEDTGGEEGRTTVVLPYNDQVTRVRLESRLIRGMVKE